MKAKKSIPKPKKDKPILVNLKVTKSQLVEMRRKAKLYAKGNVSLWVRFAATRHTPRKRDLTA